MSCGLVPQRVNTLDAVDPALQRLVPLVDAAFETGTSNPLAQTDALVVVQHGELVFERYAPGSDAVSTFISWSMAKSMTAALCGILVDRGKLDIDSPAAVPEWQQPDDPRGAITVRQLLAMRSGLQWVEDYVDGETSNVIEMLFGAGQADVAGYAAGLPLEHDPGSHWYYSSGTTNIISRLLGDLLGGREAMKQALAELFLAGGMHNATAKFDETGTFIGSSFVYATARDFAAFGELFRNQGRCGDQQVLSSEWVQECVREQAVCPDTGQGYGLQWWLARDDHGSYACNGYEGQRIQVVPPLGLTFVRLGKTDAVYADELSAFYAAVTRCFG